VTEHDGQPAGAQPEEVVDVVVEARRHTGGAAAAVAPTVVQQRRQVGELATHAGEAGVAVHRPVDHRDERPRRPFG
jgi:hypothetical protein